MSSLQIPELDFSHSPTSFVPAVGTRTPKKPKGAWTDASPTHASESPTRAAVTVRQPTSNVNTRLASEPTLDLQAKDLRVIVCESPHRHVHKTLVKREHSPPLHEQDDDTPVKRRHSLPLQKHIDNTPVKRGRSPAVPKKSDEAAVPKVEVREAVAMPTSFRCDIHASDHRPYWAIESDCKRLVAEAGGMVLDDMFLHPGGFLYVLPPGTTNPLKDGIEIAAKGAIAVSAWEMFPRPRFNGLRMSPVGGAAEYLDQNIAAMIPAVRRSVQRGRSSHEMRKRLGGWLNGLVRNEAVVSLPSTVGDDMFR